ncbi:MAG: hypothetical protein JJU37_10095 [Balneolaceae bacterium]|nr:hypothetical protein [Balneolaceae bacterium]
MNHIVNQPESTTHILVFKTSIQTPVEVQFLASLLDKQNGIASWSVELDDWEKILRIESGGISPDEVIAILERINIQCKPI